MNRSEMTNSQSATLVVVSVVSVVNVVVASAP